METFQRRAVQRLQKFVPGACLLMSAVAVVLSIGIFAHWWMGWVSAFCCVGALLESAVCALLVALCRAEKDKMIRSEDVSFPIALCGAVVAAFLAIPIRLMYERTGGGEFLFWLIVTPMVSCCVPLAIFRFADFCFVKANKEDVNRFRRHLNLHFSCKCCMKMIAEPSVKWQCEALESPKGETSFFSAMRTAFHVRGELVGAWVKLSHAGCACLVWNGEAGEDVATWQDLISVIEKKLR